MSKREIASLISDLIAISMLRNDGCSHELLSKYL